MKQNISKVKLITSYTLQGIVVIFLVIGAINNILKTETAIANAKALGYPESALLPMAIVLLAGVMCYVIPKSSITGAIILTAWFGGAVATHIIHGDSPYILLSPIVFAIIVWIAIRLRDNSVQAIIPVKK
jgi:hypothetical protein